MSSERFSSWGNYPGPPQALRALYWRDEVESLVTGEEGTLLVGCGRSYGDSCLAASDTVIGTRALDRVLAVDWQQGIVKAEAGFTLEDLIALALPHGWFPSVTPGTRYVTLGGAVANDVHGKNHHVMGAFGCHVSALGLYRSDDGYLHCSAEQNTELFNATIGGLGMTGAILWVECALQKVESAFLEETSETFATLSDFLALSARADADHQYAVAWIDCMSGPGRLGRGVHTVADHASSGGLDVDGGARLSVPLTPPVSLINPLSRKLINSGYYQLNRRAGARRVRYGKYFYPLDAIKHWNRMYGKKGFQQFQCVVPMEDANDVLGELLQRIAAASQASFLNVLKTCGERRSPGLLSFPMRGISLAVDFANHRDLARLFEELDEIVFAAGGRLYPAKDAHMAPAHFRAAYPAWERVEALRDPALMSKFWARVARS